MAASAVTWKRATDPPGKAKIQTGWSRQRLQVFGLFGWELWKIEHWGD